MVEPAPAEHRDLPVGFGVALDLEHVELGVGPDHRRSTGGRPRRPRPRGRPAPPRPRTPPRRRRGGAWRRWSAWPRGSDRRSASVSSPSSCTRPAGRRQGSAAPRPAYTRRSPTAVTPASGRDNAAMTTQPPDDDTRSADPPPLAPDPPMTSPTSTTPTGDGSPRSAGVVTAEDGRVVWDNDAYEFLDAECPDTAHPSLWRQGRLVAARASTRWPPDLPGPGTGPLQHDPGGGGSGGRRIDPLSRPRRHLPHSISTAVTAGTVR